jgi:hypothetical protein
MMKDWKQNIAWPVTAALIGLAASAEAQTTCDPELCIIEETPPPCVEQNEQYDEQGCPDDFEGSDMDFCFDDSEAAGFPQVDPGDNQLMALDENTTVDCGILRVKETGYYAIYDTELSESCLDQKDETGYLTLHNSCNTDGWAIQANVDDRYLVPDSDNQGEDCTADTDCDSGFVCREGTNHGRCCVPDAPVYMGTFLAVEGEDNVLCIRHWCPDAQARDDYPDLFINDDCRSVNSIHFEIAATAFLCKQEGYIEPCMQCIDGECVNHPCLNVSCETFCEMGPDGSAQCVDENPCDGKSCSWGCAHGLCLQPPDARGPDTDGDGFSQLADCNDDNANVNPGASEVLANGVDDDCDGKIDETEPPTPTTGSAGGPGSSAVDGTAGVDAGTSGGSSGGEVDAGSNAGATSGGGGDDAGCGCRTASARTLPARLAPSAVLLTALLLLRRRRSGSKHPRPRRAA